MGDVYGYKKIFMIGVAGFTVASLLSGLSVNSGMLVFSRLLQGSMAALMVPQVLATIQAATTGERRARETARRNRKGADTSDARLTNLLTESSRKARAGALKVQIARHLADIAR